MQKILSCLKDRKHEFTTRINQEVKNYIYRDTRYNIPFSISLFYCNETIDGVKEKFEQTLRKTDKLIVLNEYIWCVILDNIEESFHVRATENTCIRLLNFNTHKKIFSATVNSQEFDNDHLKMENSLFERVQYGLKNNVDEIVICQDYEI
jgi:hypothetical protein